MTSASHSRALLLAETTQRLHAFFHHLDEGRYAEMVEMFTADGRWLRQGRWSSGRAEVRAALDARPTGQRVRHVITNAYVSTEGADEATVEAYMTAYRQDGAAQGVARIAGPLRLNLVSTIFRRDRGEWRIAEQRLVPEFEFTNAEPLPTQTSALHDSPGRMNPTASNRPTLPKGTT